MNPRLVSPRPLVNRAEAEGISSRGGEDSSNPFPQPDEKILKKREVGVRSSSVKSTRTYPLLSALPPLSFCFRLPLRFATGSLSSSSQCSPLSRRILGFTLKLWFFCVRSRFGCLIVRWLWTCFFVNFVSSCFFSSSVSTCWISGWWIGELVVEDLNPSFENLFLAIIVFFFY